MAQRRAWDADGWQSFALQLVQLRHKAENTQSVPDKVKGDAGIEFFTLDGCLYQCYAPEEVSDVKKAASAMKAKGARDLKKLEKNKLIIGGLLQGVKAKRWILLCPFLDDKDVVSSVRKHGVAIKSAGLHFLDAGFEALVQSQDDFLSEIGSLRHLSLGPPLVFEKPTDAQVAAISAGDISIRLSEKLTRAFVNASPPDIEKRKAEYVRAHLIRENALEKMRLDHSILWERATQCLEAEERHLLTAGVVPGVPQQILSASIGRLEHSLTHDLPSFSMSIILEIAIGTVSDWLIRCPLDFPEAGK